MPADVTIDRFSLRAFIVLAEVGQVTAAARRLYTTQPALSKNLKAMEACLGFRLFDRTTRSMSLTPAGAELLVHAREAYDAMTRLEHRVAVVKASAEMDGSVQRPAARPVPLACPNEAAQGHVGRTVADRSRTLTCGNTL